ncbi:MAG: DUF1643 domain-containing protein [Alphaproteobacteria bacterium]|nr:DUF1643 domain-containing protein [Alphaproteobacteria bacterium]
MVDLLMQKSAILGGDEDRYRYELRRIWDAEKHVLTVCMLNPSTADADLNDPTILTLIHFARSWGYGGFIVVNLFAFRSPKPDDLPAATAPVGPLNLQYMNSALEQARSSGRALAAWGNGIRRRAFTHSDQADWFVGRARALEIELICLGTTQKGHPKHPMARGVHRIPRDLQPIVWRAR